MLLLGDFNLNFNIKSDTNILDFTRLLKENNIFQLSTSPTHIKGENLDLAIVNTKTQENGSSLHTETNFHTDHSPILIELKGKQDCLSNNVITRKVRKLHKMKLDKFRNNLKLEPVTDPEKYTKF